MNYTFKNTERNNKKAHEFETKSLLYLIGRIDDRDQISCVTFDCFNDVSGINKSSDKIWDIQSKNEKKLNPQKIGKYLFTLFDNYQSALNFNKFIFFCPELDANYKKSSESNNYGIGNIFPETLFRINLGLEKEVRRVYKASYNHDTEIKDFMKKVIFVEDNDTDGEYVKTITNFNEKGIKTDEFYKSIFDELRDIQSSKKNTYIENSTINEIKDVLKFKRHLYSKDIHTLIMSRVIGCDIFKYKAIPLDFFPIIENLSKEDIADVLLECNSNLSRAFFNKNSNHEFWSICEEIILYIEKKQTLDINLIFIELFKNRTFKLSYLDELTVKYLISLTLEGKK